MKTCKLLLAALLAAGTLLPANAATWRLNPNPDAGADFTSIDEAMADDRVKEGDELLLDPGTYSGDNKLTKNRLTLTGPGHFLAQNGWSNIDRVIFDKITLSEGSTIQGCCVTKYLYLKSNVKVFRCRLSEVKGDVNCSDINISSNFIYKIHGGSGNYDDQMYGNVSNNIITGSIYALRNSTIKNNTFLGNYKGVSAESSYIPLKSIKYSTIVDNIIMNQGSNSGSIFEYCSNNTVVNNVLSLTEDNIIAAYPDNYYAGATLENTFIDNITGDRYLLRDDSVAKGKATDGGECGAFGGSHPYVLSGIPTNMPSITEAKIPSTPTDGKLAITLKIAIQNE